jgi:hypothetical protein
MEKVGVLYSGGKDSSLAAYILSKLGYEVELITANFGVLDSWKYAKESAQIIGFKHKVMKFEKDVVEEASKMIITDGFPKNGINFIHRHVLNRVAKSYEIVADGTRRDDRVPWLEIDEIRSLEDRYNIEYLTPLRGVGYKTRDKLIGRIFKIIEKESDSIMKSDYEAEVRAILKTKGYDPKKFFPVHKQSRVVGLK